MSKPTTREIIDRIFKEPGIKYELTEFETIGKPIHEILDIHAKTVDTGRDAGKTKYFLKSQVPFSSGKEEVQVYVEGGKSAPEEIVRQLWVYKLIHQYGYQPDEIDLEKSVQFGTEVGTKAADIIVYTDADKETPKIIVECKKPKRKDGIEQLKSYMNAKGAPVAVWSNGSDSVILYRPYPREFDDTLVDIPRRDQEPRDVLEAKKTLLQLRKEFNFKKIVQDLEELVLADSGKDEFNEIFKLIFAKIWDEREAQENRHDVDQRILGSVGQPIDNTTFAHQVAEREHAEQRCGRWQKQRDEQEQHNRKQDALRLRDLTQLHHLDLAFLFGRQCLHDRGLDQGHEGHVGIRGYGDRSKQVRRELAGDVDRGRPVRTANDADCRGIAK